MNTETTMKTNNTTDSSVDWASSSPFNVPAYACGEWGEYVSGIDADGSTTFDPSFANAKVLTPDEQRLFAAGHSTVRFYITKTYASMLETVDQVRGF